MADKGASKNVIQNQSSTTAPWSPTLGPLTDLAGRLGSIPTNLSPEQQAALVNIQGGVNAAPNFGGQGTDLVNKLFGSDVSKQIGMLNTGFGDLTSRLSGAADPNSINPFSNPGMTGVLDTLSNDITKQVKGVYAGSGRDPSGAGSFAGSLARGLAQGEAPVIASQYNTDRSNQQSAAKTLYDAATGTAGALTTQGQVPLSNATSGFSLANLIPSLLTGPGQAQLSAANATQTAPISNITSLLSPLAALGALGSQSSGTGTSTTSQSNSPLSNILSAGLGGAGILGSTGAFPSAAGGAGWLSSLMGGAGSALSGLGGMFGLGGAGAGLAGTAAGGAEALLPLLALSDERVKKDVEPVGTTHDGQPLYTFRYLWDRDDTTPRIGLMAQDVEERDPGAVVEFGGVKAVDYNRALHFSKRIGGMLGEMRMAA